MSTQLLEPILAGGIRNIAFFNGRLLSGEDLTAEQKANQEARRRLGKANGEGIAYGLEVKETSGTSTRASPVVTVSAGLANNRKGQTLGLTEDTDVALVRATGAVTITAVGFGDCRASAGGFYRAGDGVYLLTIGPASGSEGRAPVSGLGNVSAACNTQYNVEGVQFRLLQLPLTSTELRATERLRNRVAYKCFGVEETTAFFSNPFAQLLKQYGLLDKQRPHGLTDCEVPLAVLHWTTSAGITFIDRWAVRRRLTTPSATEQWQVMASDRRASEAEAMFLQFQDHIQDLQMTETGLDTLVADQRFDYLPPGGILPLSQVGASPGINFQKFFERQSFRAPVFIDAVRVGSLLRTALVYPPINLLNREMVRLYRVIGTATPPPFLIFTSGYVPFQAEPRYDLVRWNLSHYVTA